MVERSMCISTCTIILYFHLMLFVEILYFSHYIYLKAEETTLKQDVCLNCLKAHKVANIFQGALERMGGALPLLHGCLLPLILQKHQYFFPFTILLTTFKYTSSYNTLCILFKCIIANSPAGLQIVVNGLNIYKTWINML